MHLCIYNICIYKLHVLNFLLCVNKFRAGTSRARALVKKFCRPRPHLLPMLSDTSMFGFRYINAHRHRCFSLELAPLAGNHRLKSYATSAMFRFAIALTLTRAEAGL